PLVFALRLQIAACEIVPDGVAVHVLERAGNLDVPPAAAERHDELDLMMQIVRARGERNRFVIRDEGIRGLHKEEGRLSLVMTHLTCMRSIVATDTVDATYRKARVVIRNCGGGLRRRSEHELHESED